MSKIALEGNASGTGTFTIASPNSNSNYTLTLPSSTGTVVVTGGAQTIEFAAGTAASPSITFTGDTNTGIFSPAADTIAFTEGGAEAMRIDSSGNVGIGTSALNFASGGGLIVYNNGGQARLILRNDLTGSASTDGFQIIQQGSESGNTNVNFQQAENSAMLFSTNATERMRIDSSGNVGIGTTTLNDRFNLYNSGSIYQRWQNANTGTGGSDGYQIGIDSSGNAFNWQYENLYLAFATNNTERARITSGGQFSVNTTATTTTGATHQINVVAASGARGIGVVTPTYDLQCLSLHNQATSNDNRWVYFYTESSATDRGSIDYNRGAGLTRYNTTSDATLKNIIGDSNGQKSLEILNSTRIREYAWKDDAQQNKQIGVIAQELHETYKGAVSVGGEYEVEIPAVTEQRLVSEAVLDEEGNEVEAAVYETVEVEPSRKETKYRPWAVDKTAFTFHLIAGWQAHEKLLKEAMTRIEALEAEVAALKGQ